MKCNKYLGASQYNFSDMLRFFKRAGLDLHNFSSRYLAEALKDFPEEVAKKEVDPKDYPTEYSELYDIFTVLRKDKATITKQELLSTFKISLMNVKYEEDPEQKESLKKLKESSLIKIEDAPKKKAYDRSKINKTIQNFVNYSRKDEIRL
jgi:hypothetical protein